MENKIKFWMAVYALIILLAIARNTNKTRHAEEKQSEIMEKQYQMQIKQTIISFCDGAGQFEKDGITIKCL